MFKFLIISTIIIFSLNSSGQETINPDFKNGLNSYKQKNYKEAKEHFTKVVEAHPGNISNLYNLGLTELKLGKVGAAAALWKKTLSLQPHHSPARDSLKSIVKKLPGTGQPSSWEKFRSYALSYFSINHLLFFFTIFFAGCATTCIKNFTRRHIALKNHFPMPYLPKLSIFFIACFLLVTLLFTTKVYDHLNPRGTIVADSAALFLSPTEDDIKLSELNQGTEVIIYGKIKDWVHIITISGNEGWIKLEEMMQTSGKQTL